MSEVECYVDVACPFAWATSRWLTDVSDRRDTVLTFRQMSLATLNEGAALGHEQRHHMDISLRGGRLLAAAGATAFGALYTALGRRIHVEGASLDASAARDALLECDLEAELVSAMDDESWDDAVRERHAESQDALGEPGGSPIVTIDGVTFFGPVITAIPCVDDADALFDAVLTLARVGSFAQMHRHRSGRPVFTTERV